MTATIWELLDKKLFWYKKYLSSNEAFLQGLIHAPDVAANEVDLFYGNRESLLKILESVEADIQQFLTAQPFASENESVDRTKIQHFHRERDAILKRIVALDQEIIDRLEKELSSASQQLSRLEKGKKGLAKYKSSSNYSERLNKRV
jgi:hypothetical protein